MSSFARLAVAVLPLVVVAAACGSSNDREDVGSVAIASATGHTSAGAPVGDAATGATGDLATVTTDDASPTFSVEVWADNWAAVSVDGDLVGEDSVPITTERSFNAETFTFEASLPFTIAIEARDFTETASGIEYIGKPNQQVGDGGLIAQVTDTTTGEVVAVTGADWSVLVVQRAPLNLECADDPDPDSTCESEAIALPDGWADPGFDVTAWDPATVFDAAAVDPKDGYFDVAWDDDARFVWGSDLEVDNTILTRITVDAL